MVTATYSGDTVYRPVTGTNTQNVSKADTSTTVASSANPSVSGQPVSFTATVSPVAPGSGTPGGTVQFGVDGANLGAPVTLTGGSASSINDVSLTPGTYTVTASYSGDGSFKAGTVTNTATVSSPNQTDPKPANNSSTLTIVVRP